MSKYYPQAVMTLRVLWEDYQRGSAANSKAGIYKTDVVPERVSVKINDYRTADTFDCELDYRNFPFDPRSIRSIGVTIHIEDMKSLTAYDERMQPKAETIVFQGFADEASIDFDDDSRTVKFSGRDFTAILIDTRWDGALVDLSGVRLDALIQRILNKLDSTKAIKVVARTSDVFKLPTLGQIPGGYGEAPAAGEESELKNKRNSKRQETYWDLIQDLVSRAGLIAYIEIDTLVITQPNALYKKEDSKQFIFGRNVASLSMKRKIGRFKDINLKLISMNPRLASPVIECYIPRDASLAFKKRLKLPDGDIMIEKIKEDGGKEEKPESAPFMAFNIPRAPSRERLIEIGENIFEEISRQQIEGSLKTSEMSGRNQKGIEFDLTKMRIGTPIQIQIDNSDLVGMREVDSENDRYNYLLSRGYKKEVAAFLSKTFTGFGSPFYTKSVDMTISADDGFSLDINFLNFIELKEDLIK